MVKETRIHQDLSTLWEARNENKHEIAAKLKRCVVHVDHKTALEGSFAAAILTEWDEFKSYDWNAIAEKMMQPVKIFDGRNVLELNKNINQYYIGK
jgi:UDPglucose 6-dehydrogenase